MSSARNSYFRTEANNDHPHSLQTVRSHFYYTRKFPKHLKAVLGAVCQGTSQTHLNFDPEHRSDGMLVCPSQDLIGSTN